LAIPTYAQFNHLESVVFLETFVSTSYSCVLCTAVSLGRPLTSAISISLLRAPHAMYAIHEIHLPLVHPPPRMVNNRLYAEQQLTGRPLETSASSLECIVADPHSKLLPCHVPQVRLQLVLESPPVGHIPPIRAHPCTNSSLEIRNPRHPMGHMEGNIDGEEQ